MGLRTRRFFAASALLAALWLQAFALPVFAAASRAASSKAVSATVSVSLRTASAASATATAEAPVLDKIAKTTKGTAEWRVECATPMHWVAVRFHKTPEPYNVLADQKTIPAGREGFLHELIPLEGGVKTLALQVDPAKIQSVTVYGAGSLHKAVQNWLPPAEKADLLAFPTHADDEVLFFGGAIVLAAQQGKKVQVAYLTNHWATAPRPHELLDGLWEMGVRHYPIISPFVDAYAKDLAQAQKIYDGKKFEEYETEQIRRFKPDVIVGHAENGEYGHGGHIMNTLALKEAVLSAADNTKFPASAEKYGVWDTPKLYLHNFGKTPLVLDVKKPLPLFDGRTAFEVAKAAYQKHVSQVKGTDFTVQATGNMGITNFGLFRTTVGPDAAGNEKGMFQNIVPPPPPVSSAPSAPPASSGVTSAVRAAGGPTGREWLLPAAGAAVLGLGAFAAATLRRRPKPRGPAPKTPSSGSSSSGKVYRSKRQ